VRDGKKIKEEIPILQVKVIRHTSTY
jgi:hypothetical protein